jgi:alanyl-tRNA synthetase
MLGNFSFGDYFKEDAIAFAWELLTRVYGFPPERLLISVFGGGNGLPPDDDARAIWRKVTGFGDDRIIGLGPEDNFWQMGETGPCGPNTEIHFLHGDDPRYSTFGSEPAADGTGSSSTTWSSCSSIHGGSGRPATPLPAPCVDTGAGLDRVAAALGSSPELRQRSAPPSGRRVRASLASLTAAWRKTTSRAPTTRAPGVHRRGVLPDHRARLCTSPRHAARRAPRRRLGIARLSCTRSGWWSECQYPELRERRDLIASVTRRRFDSGRPSTAASALGVGVFGPTLRLPPRLDRNDREGRGYDVDVGGCVSSARAEIGGRSAAARGDLS